MEEEIEDVILVKTPLDNVQTTFKHEIIKEVLKTKFNNPKNKIADDVIELVSEIAKTLVSEAAVRSIKQAKAECRNTVTLEHVETILPQLILDFP